MELRLVLAAFAVYRVAELLSIDDGPYHLFARWRLWLGRKSADKPYLGTWHNLAELFQCPYCIGVWLAGLAVIPVFFPSTLTDFVLALLAISGLQAFLETLGNNTGRQT
jgi:hypothetical protein